MTPRSGYRFYPPYLNASRDINTGKVTVTLRGDEYGDTPHSGSEAQAVFSKEEFALFLINAMKNLTD